MKTENRFTLFSRVFAFLLAMGVALVCGTAMGQEQGGEEEFILEDIVVSAQFTETNLQETPISITAITGEMLEERNIQGVEDAEAKNNILSITCESQIRAKVISSLEEAGLVIDNIKTIEPSLEDAFIKLIEGDA